jgi:hypothetical protein
MSLLRSRLCASTAGAIAALGAQAADLPSNKGARAAGDLRICNVGGVTGWAMPGSDACVKFSGYIEAQFEAGNLTQQWTWAGNQTTRDGTLAGAKVGLAPGAPNWARDATGWTTRLAFGFDFASNTAYGPLLGHADFEFNAGNGFDSQLENYLNLGYVSWAGITAGRATSFFSFLNGGPNWANIFSPDRLAYNQPILMAYTASFDGGLTASLSFESTGRLSDGPGTNWQSNGFNILNSGDLTYAGQRWPDGVARVHAKEGWGEAQIAAAAHEVDVEGTNGFAGSPTAREHALGWAVLAGGKINLPSLGDGDDVQMQAVFSRNAIWYSGIPEEMVNENGQTNGNGQQQFLADAYFNGRSWGVPSAGSIAAYFEHHVSPQFSVTPEASVASLKWSHTGGLVSPSMTSLIVGADLGWTPAANLSFDLELMFQSTDQAKPAAYVGTNPWVGNSSGFAGRLRIQRNF